MKPIDRFLLPSGAGALVDALKNQQMLLGDVQLAEALAEVAELTEYGPGEKLIEQGDAGNDIYFLLIGDVSVVVNGQELALRHAGQHVGEMGLIDVSALRVASVVARTDVVAAAVSQAELVKLAESYPEIWRRIAIELGNRLRQRSKFVRQRNSTPIVFIGSSRESLPIADQIVAGLEGRPMIIRPWTGGVFTASEFPIDDLVRQVLACDFAALVLGPDDKVLSRGVSSDAPRDNVIFELGLFMGVLERSRTFLVTPRDIPIKLPTDILGITPLTYTNAATELEATLAQAAEAVARIVVSKGPR